MIAYSEITDMSELSGEEIDALTDTEYPGRINAIALAQYVLEHYRGSARVQDMICADIRDALSRHSFGEARDLFATLKHFIAYHPEAMLESQH